VNAVAGHRNAGIAPDPPPASQNFAAVCECLSARRRSAPSRGSAPERAQYRRDPELSGRAVGRESISVGRKVIEDL